MSPIEQLIDDRVRAIVAEELQRLGIAGPPRNERLLYTVPEAAKLTSISAVTLREWIETGRLPRRVKNPDAKKKHVFLVSLDEIRAVSAGEETQTKPASPVNLSAARIARAR